jgi:hypothetical protein
MKPSISKALVIALLAGVTQLAHAQHPTSSTNGEPLAPAAVPPWTTPPKEELAGLASDNGQSYHVSGTVAFGTYWAHGGGFSSGALLGASGSLGVFGEHAGVGLGWTDFSSTKAGSWSYSHRP